MKLRDTLKLTNHNANKLYGELADEMASYRVALERYGRHDPDCHIVPGVCDRIDLYHFHAKEHTCSCGLHSILFDGLTAALAATQPKEEG